MDMQSWSYVIKLHNNIAGTLCWLQNKDLYIVSAIPISELLGTLNGSRC